MGLSKDPARREVQLENLRRGREKAASAAKPKPAAKRQVATYPEEKQRATSRKSQGRAKAGAASRAARAEPRRGILGGFFDGFLGR